MESREEEASLLQRVAVAHANLMHGRTSDRSELRAAVVLYAAWLRGQDAPLQTTIKLVTMALDSPLVARVAGDEVRRGLLRDAAITWAIEGHTHGFSQL